MKKISLIAGGRKLIGKDGAHALCALTLAITVLFCGGSNMLHSLGFSAVTEGEAIFCSVLAVVLYTGEIFLSLLARNRDLCATNVLFWGSTLLGFFFYACYYLLDMPLVIPIPHMTAVLRLFMTLFSLPLLAYNRIILALPWVWSAFVFALALPVTGLILHLRLYRLLPSKKSKKKADHHENENPPPHSGGGEI